MQWFTKPHMIRLPCSLSDLIPFYFSFFHNTLTTLAFLLFLHIPRFFWPQGLCNFCFFCLEPFPQIVTWLVTLLHSGLYLSVVSSERPFLTTLCKEGAPPPHYSPFPYSALVFFLPFSIIWFDIYLLIVYFP